MASPIPDVIAGGISEVDHASELESGFRGSVEQVMLIDHLEDPSPSAGRLVVGHQIRARRPSVDKLWAVSIRNLASTDGAVVSSEIVIDIGCVTSAIIGVVVNVAQEDTHDATRGGIVRVVLPVHFAIAVGPLHSQSPLSLSAIDGSTCAHQLDVRSLGKCGIVRSERNNIEVSCYTSGLIFSPSCAHAHLAKISIVGPPLDVVIKTVSLFSYHNSWLNVQHHNDFHVILGLCHACEGS